MYIYDELDKKIVRERTTQFRDQTNRYLSGQLSEDEFRPLRLQNGLYVQRYAPMLRIAVPYGLISSRQLREVASITRDYDKGYAHISTRTNIQLNWVALEDVPNVLERLASVDMHCIQTSGNCIRNTTTSELAGIDQNECVDPRPWCEVIRQWSTFHPEFAYLPRKFKIAVNASNEDRAAIEVHDIGLEIFKEVDDVYFKIYVGGGLGRTPIIGTLLYDKVRASLLLSYLDAILRVYNIYGRRDNKFKARIKILIKALGAHEFRRLCDEELKYTQTEQLTLDAFAFIQDRFTTPKYEKLENEVEMLAKLQTENQSFARFVRTNTLTHKVPGYIAVVASLKKIGIAPGDVTDKQLDLIAELADDYSFSEVVTTHHQNIVLQHVPQKHLFALWEKMKEFGLVTPNIGLLTDMICCPGGDLCSLANAKSIPIAQNISMRFNDLDYLHDLGDIELNISGCMNACGHHHIGNIGILGVDKKGEEFYQVSLGGFSGKNAKLGQIVGPSFKAEQMPDVIEKIISVFVSNRVENELFIEVFARIGIEPFKQKLYL